MSVDVVSGFGKRELVYAKGIAGARAENRYISARVVAIPVTIKGIAAGVGKSDIDPELAAFGGARDLINAGMLALVAG